MNLCSVDGVVRRDVEILRIRCKGVVLGDVRVVFVFRRGYKVYFAEELRFFDGFRCPCTGVEVGGFFLQQVVGYHAELEARATAEEDDFVCLRHMKQLFN